MAKQPITSKTRYMVYLFGGRKVKDYETMYCGIIGFK